MYIAVANMPRNPTKPSSQLMLSRSTDTASQTTNNTIAQRSLPNASR